MQIRTIHYIKSGKLSGWLFFILLVLTGGRPSLYAADDHKIEDQINETRRLIQQAVNHNNQQMLLTARDIFKQMDAIDKYRAIIYYYVGYTDYRLATLFYKKQDDKKAVYVDEAIRYLKRAVKTNPDFIDARALLGACYGMKISGPFSAMKYGPKSNAALTEFPGKQMTNPRVPLLQGISDYFKPAFFGGSSNKALDKMEKSARLFDQASHQSDFDIRWGYDEVYAWMGKIYMEQKDYRKARSAFGKALAINPDYGWVIQDLIPQLNELQGNSNASYGNF